MQSSMANSANQSNNFLTSFPLAHDDFVHDVSYDFYGKRLATCSSDQKIKIWELQESRDQKKDNEKPEWVLINEITGNKGHAGAVWKVKWADPEFGGILASCGYDKQVFIWEEIVNKDTQQRYWDKKVLSVFKDSVQDIKFAPKHWGLQIAVAVSNGNVQIFEPGDLNNLNSWTEISNFKASSSGCNCISWNPAFDELPMIVVGCNEYEIIDQKDQQEQKEAMQENLLQIWKKDNQQSFKLYAKFKGGHKSTINDVAWAPLAGRSFHLIASCSKDKTIIVWKVVTKNMLQGGAVLDIPEIEKLQIIDKHQSEVWRLSWNLLGTCLASSGDDGTVRIWKKSIKQQFSQLAVLQSKNGVPPPINQ